MTSDVRLDLYQDSKKKSIVESITDIVIGFLMYLPINFFVLPMFADQIANQEIIGFLQITAIFTMVAFVRKYTIRRWFSKMRFWMKILNLIERIPHMEKNEETANNLFDESTKKYFEKKFPRALELIDDAIRYDPSNNVLYCLNQLS